MLNIVIKTQSSGLCSDMVQNSVSGALEKIIHDRFSLLLWKLLFRDEQFGLR